MIHELRTYSIAAGQLGTVVKNAGETGRAIRGDGYGRLEGYWTTEIGPLGKVVHLWSYPSLDERRRLRAALARNRAWVEEYLPLLHPHLVRQEIRLLDPFLPFKAPERAGNVYELRCYRVRAGRVREWADLFRAVMPVRERYSKNVGAWVTEAPQPNEVCHLWAYPGLDARMAIRAEVGKDPDWQAFLKRSAPLVEEAHSTILLPAPHSPLC